MEAAKCVMSRPCRSGSPDAGETRIIRATPGETVCPQLNTKLPYIPPAACPGYWQRYQYVPEFAVNAEL